MPAASPRPPSKWKIKTPLLVDADRMEFRQIAAQLLEVIAGRRAQVLIGRCIDDHPKLAEQPDLKIGQDIP
jgi:hypothetical protein